MGKEASPEKVVQEIRRKTRRRFSAEEKIRIVLEGPARRGEHRHAVPEGRARAESVLPLEQGVSRSREEAARRRYEPRGDGARSHGPAEGEHAPEAARGRDRAREPAAEKKRDGLRLGRRHVRLTAAEKARSHSPGRRARICRCGRRCANCRSRAPRSTRWYRRYAEAGLEGSRPARRRRAGTGIASRRGCGSGSSISRLAVARAHAAGTRLAIHRPRGAFPLGIERLSHPESLRPYHQPGLRRAGGGQDVSAADAPAQRALADRLHVSPRRRLGLVLPARPCSTTTRGTSWRGRCASSMQATDVMETLDLARAATGVDHVPVAHRPRLLSDNGPCYISGAARHVSRRRTACAHTRSAPYHPMTQGKIERYHRSLKNVVKLEHYYSPWEVERAVAHFVEDYNHRRYHEALQNVTPADMCHGRQADDPGATRAHQTADAAATETREFTDAASRGHSLGSVSVKRG